MSDWKYDIDEVGPDGLIEEEDTAPPIEPGSPSMENAAFLVIGIGMALYVFAKLLGLG